MSELNGLLLDYVIGASSDFCMVTEKGLSTLYAQIRDAYASSHNINDTIEDERKDAHLCQSLHDISNKLFIYLIYYTFFLLFYLKFISFFFSICSTISNWKIFQCISPKATYSQRIRRIF